jgi:FSR family fosmidomycin resistance protein-like MFS transporter
MEITQSTPKPISTLGFLFDRRFFPSALGHFSVDLLNGQRSVLFTYFAVLLGMSNATLGLVSFLYVLSSAVSQPVMGWVADRVGNRIVAAGGVLWMIGFYALSLVVPGVGGIILLLVASAGSGAFHAAGAAQATLAGKALMAGRAVTAASFFFVFGQAGYSIGPLMAGNVVESVGVAGLLAVCAVLLGAGIYIAWAFKPVQAVQPVSTVKTSQNGRRWSTAVVVLIFIAAFQSWVQTNVSTFMPKYLSDLGENAAMYGMLPALFSAGVAVGNIIGGNLADRFGRQRIIMLGLGLSSIPLFFIPLVGVSGWLYVTALVSGFFMGLPFAVVVVLAQEMVPVGMGFASGLVLSFLFACGAVGTLISGWIADRWGFVPVFILSAGLALAGGVLALGLKKTART